MTENLTIKIYKSFDEPLKDGWIKFEESSENYCFQNFFWLNSWYEQYSKDKVIDPCIVVVYLNNKILAILPFTIHKIKLINVLTWMGGKQADYMCGLFAKNFSLNKNEFLNLWELIQKKLPTFDIVHFYNQPEHINTIENPFIKYLQAWKSGYSSGINLTSNFEEYVVKNLRKKFLNDTKRSLNQLNNMGNLELKIHDNSNNENKVDFIEKILEQKILRLNQLKIKDDFSENIQKFYSNFNNDYFKNGELHIASLELDGKIIASHWGVIYKNVFYYLLPSIVKSDLMKFSPGRILLFNLIKWSFANSIKKFDLTLGEESYKKEWVNTKISLYDYYGPKSLKTYPLFIFLILKLKTKIIIKKLLN